MRAAIDVSPNASPASGAESRGAGAPGEPGHRDRDQAQRHGRGEDAPVQHGRGGRRCLRCRRESQEHEPENDHAETDPVPSAQGHVQHDGAEDGGDGEKARDDGLYDEQRERSERGEGEQEREPVQCEAENVRPGAQEPQEQPGVEALCPVRPSGGDGLQDRCHTVGQGCPERAQQAEDHARC